MASLRRRMRGRSSSDESSSAATAAQTTGAFFPSSASSSSPVLAGPSALPYGIPAMFRAKMPLLQLLPPSRGAVPF